MHTIVLPKAEKDMTDGTVVNTHQDWLTELEGYLP